MVKTENRDTAGIRVQPGQPASRHKTVENIELFYDLVFAYAISNLTAILENAKGSGISWQSFGLYLLAFVILVNSWMYQTVFNNRYGQKTLFHTLIMFTDMALLLFLASSLQDDLLRVFVPFTRVLGLLSATMFLQYVLAYRREQSPADRQLIRDYFLMLGVRTIVILIASFLPVNIGFPVAVCGVLLGWILPVFFERDMMARPVDFAYFSKRLKLLTILMFGEMILNMAVWFNPHDFGPYGVVCFALCASLFSCYILFTSHLKTGVGARFTGVHATFLHYPILIGLDLVTASMRFLKEPRIPAWLAVLCLFGGLFSFYAGMYGGLRYLQQPCEADLKRLVWMSLLIPLAAIPAWWLHQPLAALLLALASALFQLTLLVHAFGGRKRSGHLLWK